MLTTIPRLFAGAISDRNNGAVTVKPPAPTPLKILALSSRAYMPEDNTCTIRPEAHVRTKRRQHLSRPSRSDKARDNREPKAAPRTPKEDMLAFRSAKPDGLSTQLAGMRLKSCLKDFKPTEALKPPSSYPEQEFSIGMYLKIRGDAIVPFGMLPQAMMTIVIT